MSEKFSATLRIGDLNDYIAPSQGCVIKTEVTCYWVLTRVFGFSDWKTKHFSMLMFFLLRFLNSLRLSFVLVDVLS